VKYATVIAKRFAQFQPSGSLKPTDMGSDQPQPSVLSDTDNRLMSSDMSRPLTDKSDGTTQYVQVAKTCLPSGHRLKKTPIFN
jgi:hypothetical protein